MISAHVRSVAGFSLALSLGGSVVPGSVTSLHDRPMLVATPAAEPLDSLTISYEVAGVKVIHRPVSATDVVAVNLYLLGGSRQVTPATAGIEPFMLYASEYGTQKYPGEAARRALGHTGSWINVQATPDYTRLAFRGIKQEFDSTWAIFADRLMHPTLDSAAMAIVRVQLMTTAKTRDESPEAHAARVADSLAFESHPYGIPPLGTQASIAALTADDIRKYATDQMVTSRMLLVVVGAIPREQVERAVTSTLGTLPRGSYAWTLPPEWPAKTPRVVAVQRRLPTNYMFGYFSGPRMSSPDYPAFTIATGFLGSVLEEVIRGEGLSYSAGAFPLEYGATGGGIYVSTVRPDTVVKIINTAIDFIKQEPLARSGLVKHAQRYLSRYYYQNESSAERASVLALAQLYQGDFRSAASYGDVLRRVTGGDVRTAARKYVKNIQYGYVGDTTRAPIKLMLKP